MSGWGRALLAVLAAVLGGAAGAQAKNGITWMTADLPPAAIFDGVLAGNGFADQQLKVLIATLPDYDHQVVKGTIARNWHELETRDGVCFNWVTHNSASHWNAVFSKRPVPNPGYRVMVRTGRLTEFLPFAATGELDLALLAKSGMSGGYISSRDYLPAINGFIAANPRMQKTMNSEQLLELLRANRVDFVFASPTEVKFYREAMHLSDDFSVLKVKGAPIYNEGYIACSSGPLGKEVMAKIDAFLDRPEGWAAYVAPLQSWLDPADYSFAAASHGR